MRTITSYIIGKKKRKLQWVWVKDNEAVGVNILTQIYCSGEASDVL